jgi:hypothetical protein
MSSFTKPLRPGLNPINKYSQIWEILRKSQKIFNLFFVRKARKIFSLMFSLDKLIRCLKIFFITGLYKLNLKYCLATLAILKSDKNLEKSIGYFS